jgi:hypothetical protein
MKHGQQNIKNYMLKQFQQQQQKAAVYLQRLKNIAALCMK